MAGKIKLEIDSSLEDLIPGFLERLGENYKKMREALVLEDLETIRVIGHNMKGSGSGYGFDLVSELGRRLENGARNEDRADIEICLSELGTYMDSIEIVYV